MVALLFPQPGDRGEPDVKQGRTGGSALGEDRRLRYPPGNDPIVLGEAANTALTYGYDPVTQMQETKVSLCRIEKA